MSSLQLAADVTVIVDRNATAAEIFLIDADTLMPLATVTGSSKREQGDIFTEATAINLAVGRAFEKLGRELKRRGLAQVKDAMLAAEAKRAMKELGIKAN